MVRIGQRTMSCNNSDLVLVIIFLGTVSLPPFALSPQSISYLSPSFFPYISPQMPKL